MTMVGLVPGVPVMLPEMPGFGADAHGRGLPARQCRGTTVLPKPWPGRLFVILVSVTSSWRG